MDQLTEITSDYQTFSFVIRPTRISIFPLLMFCWRRHGSSVARCPLSIPQFLQWELSKLCEHAIIIRPIHESWPSRLIHRIFTMTHNVCFCVYVCLCVCWSVCVCWSACVLECMCVLVCVYVRDVGPFLDNSRIECLLKLN